MYVSVGCDVMTTVCMCVCVKSTLRDASVRADLCNCPEFVNRTGDGSNNAILDSDVMTLLEPTMTHPLPYVTKKSLEPEVSDETCVASQPSAVVPAAAAGQSMVEADSEQREVVSSVENVCIQLKECDLDDSVEYEYVCEESVGCSNDDADEADDAGAVSDEGGTKMASITSLSHTSPAGDSTSDDADAVSDESSTKMASITSLSHTSPAGNSTSMDTSTHNEEDKLSLCSAKFAAKLCFPQPPDADGAGNVCSSADMFSSSYKQSECTPLRDTSVEIADDVFESDHVVLDTTSDDDGVNYESAEDGCIADSPIERSAVSSSSEELTLPPELQHELVEDHVPREETAAEDRNRYYHCQCLARFSVHCPSCHQTNSDLTLLVQ